MSYTRYMRKRVSNESFDEGNTDTTNHVSVTFNSLSDLDEYQLDIQKDIDVLATLSYDGLVEPSSLVKAATEGIYWKLNSSISKENQASTPSASTPSASSSNGSSNSGNNSSNNSNSSSSSNNAQTQTAEQKKAEQEQAKQKRENEGKVKSFFRMVVDAVKKIFAKIGEVVKAILRFLGIISKDSAELAEKLSSEEGMREVAEKIVENTRKTGQPTSDNAQDDVDEGGDESPSPKKDNIFKRGFKAVKRGTWNHFTEAGRMENAEHLKNKRGNIGFIPTLKNTFGDINVNAGKFKKKLKNYISDTGDSISNMLYGDKPVKLPKDHPSAKHFCMEDYGGYDMLEKTSVFESYTDIADKYIKFTNQVMTVVNYEWLWQLTEKHVKGLGNSNEVNFTQAFGSGRSETGRVADIKTTFGNVLVKELLIIAKDIIGDSKAVRITPLKVLQSVKVSSAFAAAKDYGRDGTNLIKITGPYVVSDKIFSGNLYEANRTLLQWRKLATVSSAKFASLETALNNLEHKARSFQNNLIPASQDRIYSDVENLIKSMGVSIEIQKIDVSAIVKAIIEGFRYISSDVMELLNGTNSLLKDMISHVKVLMDACYDTIEAAEDTAASGN